MKLIKEYQCDGKITTKVYECGHRPTEKEIIECIEIVNSEDCAVRLDWLVFYSGWYSVIIKKDMDFEKVKEEISSAHLGESIELREKMKGDMNEQE